MYEEQGRQRGGDPHEQFAQTLDDQDDYPDIDLLNGGIKRRVKDDDEEDEDVGGDSGNEGSTDSPSFLYLKDSPSPPLPSSVTEQIAEYKQALTSSQSGLLLSLFCLFGNYSL